MERCSRHTTMYSLKRSIEEIVPARTLAERDNKFPAQPPKSSGNARVGILQGKGC